MNLPQTEQTPDDPQNMQPARRRRARRLLLPLSASERESFLDKLSQRLSPSFDFFLFSLLAGAIIGAGLLIDSPAFLVLGALFAPTMAPLVGLSLGTVTGSTRFFVRSLIGLVIASILVLLVGALAGYAANLWGISELIQVYFHAQLIWHNLLVLAVGAILTSISLVRSRRRAAVASVALAYELFVPLTVAGFGLGSGLPHLWPDGLVVFAVHLAWAALLGAITLAILGFRPLTLFGYTIGGVVALVGAIVLIGLSGAGAAFWGQVAIPTPSPTATLTPTATASTTPTPTSTFTPVPPSATLPPTVTPSITPSPSYTPSPSPTPVYALVNTSEEYKGAILRAGPGFSEEFVTSALNGTLIQILSDKPVVANKVLWLHVRLPDGREGWMLQSALLAATPAPNW
ncbi:MAG: DUF389 domain-containing protein [Chloroflexi bacterium]|nr:DUF389 domain-containing protein [Chloroflexota bacterium]